MASRRGQARIREQPVCRCEPVYFVSSFRNVIKSFLSLSFLRPPNAIFVPGMYFLGFSRYSNWICCQYVLSRKPGACVPLTYQSLIAPRNVFRLVRLRVRKAFYRAGVPSPKPVEVGTDLVALLSLQVVTLCTSCLELKASANKLA